MKNFKFFMAGFCCFMAGWLMVSFVMPEPLPPATKAAIEAKEAREHAARCGY